VRLTAVHQPDPISYFFEGPSACEPGANGDIVLAGGQSCVVLIRFFATSQFARTTDTLVATATDAQTGEAAGSRSVKIDARGFEPTLAQLIDLGHRELIRTWAAERSIATLNAEVVAPLQPTRSCSSCSGGCRTATRRGCPGTRPSGS
jgi:hypothetical protein